ncbi:hypothetical protein H0O02_03460 [Candidatus Micrarchaeota archaeon]|nr:hypothetical protein [Candidatus Micrarchaeota archaeon]
MVEVFSIAILDYTPMEMKYSESRVKDILVSAMRESVPRDYIVATDYIRCFRDGMPERKYDMMVIAGSMLPTDEPSRNLDIALEQINGVIHDVPTLGICFGLHAIALLAGNSSRMISDFEIGPKEVLLFSDIEGVGKCGDTLLFPVNHFYKIRNESGALDILAISSGGIQIADATKHFGGNPVMGVQFHPEFAATSDGWKLFRRVYARAVEDILNGEYAGVSLEPVLRILDKEVLSRLKEIAPEPQRLIGNRLGDAGKAAVSDLLMSPFHNIDFRKKLLGKIESERDYDKTQRNCRAILQYFVKRAIEAKNARKTARSEPEARFDTPHGTQLELSDLKGKAGEDAAYRAEVRKIFKRCRESGKNAEKPTWRKPLRQMKIAL